MISKTRKLAVHVICCGTSVSQLRPLSPGQLKLVQTESGPPFIRFVLPILCYSCAACIALYLSKH